MLERITARDVEAVAANLSRRLGYAPHVVVEGRNGHFAADEYRSEDGRAICVRTLVVGTKREVYDALWYMIRGIDLYAISREVAGEPLR